MIWIVLCLSRFSDNIKPKFLLRRFYGFHSKGKDIPFPVFVICGERYRGSPGFGFLKFNLPVDGAPVVLPGKTGKVRQANQA
ncbi:MAG: hypothetical protein M3Z23_07190 [Acidobacteriota bacterium]|nr:hypothetical protein [Acidobacteriota bacterium]